MSFIQALTEAMKAEPRAILLASLPESDLEVGGDVGQRALATLEKYFGRVHYLDLHYLNLHYPDVDHFFLLRLIVSYLIVVVK